MTLIYLVEITAGVSGSPTETILRAASAPGYNHSSAPGFYKPRLIQAGNISRNIVAPRRTFGESDIAFGTIELDNIDGFYDQFFDFGYGFVANVLIGDHEDLYSNFSEVTTGKVEQATGTKDKIIFRFKDRQLELDRLISPVAYAGNNFDSPGVNGICPSISACVYCPVQKLNVSQ